MPRRRRNRRNRRGHAKKSGNVTNKDNFTESPSNYAVRACYDEESLNKTKPVSPVELVTPLRTPNNPQLNNTAPFEDGMSSIRTTPVNKKRSMTRPERKKCNSMNVTNLNILFDSSFVRHSPSEVYLNKPNHYYRKRSNSSIPKLHSPVTEKPRSVSQNGQIKILPLPEVSQNMESMKCNEILETPKKSRVLLIDNTKSVKVHDPSLNNKSVNDKINNCDRMKFYNGEVNINPYLNKEVNIFHKDGSFGEISFFSPNLFEHKSSSTPIEKLNRVNANNIMDYLRDSLRKENDCSLPLIEKLDAVNNSSPGAPQLNLNLNNTSVSEKVLDKEESLRNLKMQSINLSKRRSYRTSPKSNRILSQQRIFNKSHTLTYSRLSISRRSSGDSMDSSLSKHSRGGFGDKLLTRLKKYTRVSHRWSVRVMEMCTHLGVQLKNSLSSMCNMYNDGSMLENSDKRICKCEEYKEEILQLNSKIEELTEEIRIVKSQLDLETTNKQNIELLSQELNKVREELSQFRELRSELGFLKEQFKCLNSTPVAPTAVIPPPPPLPVLPPPPPPPLPPPPLLSTSLKITKNAKLKTSCNDNSRPVISLDDILKVKLKKTSDRSGSMTTPTTRRHSQPLVSMDMLKQVRLRPASRPSFRPDTPDTGASSASTSPHSSLCRLLLVNDAATFRLKRLRKVGGYSFDSVHRKNLAWKREREGS